MTPTDTLREAVARTMLFSQFGDDANAFYEPVPDDFPKAAEARAVFAARIERALREADAALMAIEAAGWRVVPVEPTQDMTRAANRAVAVTTPDGTWALALNEASRAYTAMLSAAPRLDATVRSGEEG